MKQKIVNGRWALITTDAVADWDGGTGDYSVRRGWEFERFESFRQRLKYGDVFFDVGAEHGWISAIIGREFVGAENMVLFEPGAEFWINIRKVWEYNGLNEPLGCFYGFVGADSTDKNPPTGWPEQAEQGAPEVGGMPYETLENAKAIPTISIDDYVQATNHIPDAINVDVEGAELVVMKGAINTLADHRPIVWVSVHPDLMVRDHGTDKEEFLSFMYSNGYVGKLLGTDHEEHWIFE